MLKKDELIKGCIAAAHEDEPVFVLRAQDKLAPALVEAWARLASEHGCGIDKVQEALRCAAAMISWPSRKFPD